MMMMLLELFGNFSKIYMFLCWILTFAFIVLEKRQKTCMTDENRAGRKSRYFASRETKLTDEKYVNNELS